MNTTVKLLQSAMDVLLSDGYTTLPAQIEDEIKRLYEIEEEINRFSGNH